MVQRPPHLVVIDAGSGAERDVVSQRRVEEHDVLGDDADVPVPSRRQCLRSIDEDAPSTGLDETQDDVGESALSRTGSAGDGEQLAAANLEVDLFDRGLAHAGVGELDAFEPDRVLEQALGRGCLVDALRDRGSQVARHVRDRLLTVLQPVERRHHLVQRRDDSEGRIAERTEHRHEVVEGVARLYDADEREQPADHDELQGARRDLVEHGLVGAHPRQDVPMAQEAAVEERLGSVGLDVTDTVEGVADVRQERLDRVLADPSQSAEARLNEDEHDGETAAEHDHGGEGQCGGDSNEQAEEGARDQELRGDAH